jgi:sugar phosphate isomerase/epimerase
VKVGIDSWTIHHRGDLVGIPLLSYVQSLGLDGIQLGNVGQLSPALDHGEIREAAEFARANDLYVEIGIPCPNPHIQDKMALRDGDGDLLTGLRRHLDAAAVAAVGSRTIRCFVGGPGDRHAGKAPWPDQIAGTIEVSRQLAPVLREHGFKLAFENHAEATCQELVEVVEQIRGDLPRHG